MEIEYHRPWLYPKQVEAIFCPQRYSFIEASTKAGKTVGCLAWIAEQAFMGGGDGRNYWWVAPVGSQAEIAFTRILRFLPQGTFNAIRSAGSRRVILLNGAIIWFKGADRPDSLYGDDVHGAVIDEGSRCKAEAWHAVRSTLTFTRGPVRAIGNVKGRKNWFYEQARKAEQGLDPEMAFHRIDAYDAVDAGVLSGAEIEDAKRRLPEAVFQELYLARASDDEGNPFGMKHIEGCVAPLFSTSAPAWWGWDLAKRQDYTVGIALDATGHVCRFERVRGMPWDDIIAMIKRVTGRAPAMIDSTGVGDPIVDHLQRAPGSHFEGYHFTPASKQKLMEGLSVAIQGRNVTFPDGPIRNELEQFEYQYTRTGVRYSAPEGYNDDCVIALALAQMCRITAPLPVSVSPAMLTRIMSAPRRRGVY